MADSVAASGKADLVKSLYNVFLRRDPGPKEHVHWAQFLEKNSLDSLIHIFLASPEYKARHRILPAHPPGHYYSPIVDPQEIDQSQLGADLPPEELGRLGVSLARMDVFWDTNREAIVSARFPRERAAERRYYLNNPYFSYADALMLRAMILVHQPRRIIEIGSGYSSAVTLDTLDEMRADTAGVTFIEPEPDRLLSLLRAEDKDRVRVVPHKVQQVALTEFDSLEANDILFIDSSHVLKAQSDVCFEFFSIMPRLRSGVLIHFHDIFYPFEYPASWIMDRGYSWNEAYALRLFLSDNPNYQVMFFNNMYSRKRQAKLRQDCPPFADHGGGSIWIRKL